MNQAATPQWTNPNIFQIPGDAWKVRSRSHPTAFHTVRDTRNGRRCSCPATVARCQHIKDVEQMIELERMTNEPAPAIIDAPDEDVFAAAPLAIACRGCGYRLVIEPGGSLLCGGCTAVMGAPVPAMPVAPPVETFSVYWSDRTPFEVWARAQDAFWSEREAA